MRKRRVTIGWQLLEDPDMRTFRHAWSRMTVDQILEEPRRVRLETFWCAADKPMPGRGDVAPVYTGSAFPEDAECSTCGIRLTELREMFG